MKKKRTISDIIVTLIMTVMALTFVYPIFMVLINSFKANTSISTDSVFQLPDEASFVGLKNYIYALEAKGFFDSFIYSLFSDEFLSLLDRRKEKDE